MSNIREIVLNILIEYDRGGARKPSLLKDSLDKYDYLDTRDKAFIKRVTDGCLERNLQIDYVLNSFSKVPVKDMQPFIRSLMRMSVYQIMFMDSVPDSAACNEAVKLAAKHKFAGLKGFVNGVLRNIARNKDKIEYPSKEIDGGIQYLSVVYSMPDWICKMWVSEYGFEKTESMLKFFLTPRPTTIRLTKGLPQSRDVEEFKKELEEAGIVVRQNPLLPYALELEKTDNIRYIPGFKEGVFAVQDVSSMLVVEVADPEIRQTVVDVCAAPGGKSMHAAERVYPSGKVFSRDVSAKKCLLVEENALRLGLNNVTTKVYDAKIHDEELRASADILLLDVPCSGLGILGRKNDIKHNTKPQGLEEITKLQWDIIKATWDYVKVGGTLIYSTCTVNKAENEMMVKRICDELPFKPDDITEKLPEKLRKSAGQGYIQLIPGEHGTDGFFIAKLKRV
ncbi:16S rRNA (cytosine(967)-C(5))-methyltransferase RsmB [Butyrivibrio sp. YAB3001]|uniref:16S rRNA (cytosine(967)-C(5))-methyltransferase RsmB n=1 Tax=Butyrivibrio sp. YAB3001 TaxID=1520812 RepID=UPI0008F61B3A|nr:16S rRNA (cytosine(967)-C(5))-methyltransferase RsmB [Butyrivibrio sp. YAB3001]SFB74545.1 16S rRNA (cytosine967-C5)-methyltransferase [Butyrivibrio sp. YAB3001]